MMKTTDKISPADAINIAAEYGVSITTETIRDWCIKFKIGKKIVGRYQVNPVRLKLLLEGKTWENTNEKDKH